MDFLRNRLFDLEIDQVYDGDSRLIKRHDDPIEILDTVILFPQRYSGLYQFLLKKNVYTEDICRQLITKCIHNEEGLNKLFDFILNNTDHEQVLVEMISMFPKMIKKEKFIEKYPHLKNSW